MLNLMKTMLVCEETKTLAALQQQFIEAPENIPKIGSSPEIT
jgi:hypothetical protein